MLNAFLLPIKKLSMRKISLEKLYKIIEFTRIVVKNKKTLECKTRKLRVIRKLTYKNHLIKIVILYTMSPVGLTLIKQGKGVS